MHAETRTCGKCGTRLNAEGLCPVCLLDAGMATRTVEFVGSLVRAEGKRPEVGALFGDYQIVRRLGRGGMGEVFEAEDTRTGRRVAIKVLNQALASDEDRRRFIREGRMAATVSDPHVVYVYGSEEIEGAPVIAMELATGGTLKDRIKKERPLAPAEAVDDILQVMAGLEIAQAAGVLHRDIKPANCFVDLDGKVKVGDFGLSISTLGHMESQNLTMPGSLLGTPAYASPEQLRGDKLDVRADIYSLGATLYHLLTGRPPFEGDTIVNLIAQVFNRVPDSPENIRAEIPARLGVVVMRCLAKDPKARPANYAELRGLLLPFSSRTLAPANPGIRFVAGVVDSLLYELPSIALLMLIGRDMTWYLLGQRDAAGFAAWCAYAAWVLLLFGICEGRFGASLGKYLCGLRVVGPDGNAPGVRRAVLRAVIFWLSPLLPMFAGMAWISAAEYRAAEAKGTIFVHDLLCMALVIVLFVTMRRRNGFAAVQDLVSGTRVVVRSTAQARPALGEAILLSPRTASSAAGVPPLCPTRIGPYAVLDDTGGSVVLARDEVLRRNVWIVQHAPGTPPLAPQRRDLARPGRLRWLNGVRTATAAWDAFEAPEGRPLKALAGGLQPWASVRFWLHDLAEEISAGMKDGSLPPLAVENVFITAQGRAVLLDIGVHGSADTSALPPKAVTSGAALAEAQSFLADVATVALGMECGGLPVAAGRLLRNLREGSVCAIEFITGALKSLCETVPAISRRRRFASLAFGPGCFAVLGVFVSIMFTTEARRYDRAWDAAHPDLVSPRMIVSAHGYFDGDPTEQRKLLRFAGTAYASVLADPETLTELKSASWLYPDSFAALTNAFVAVSNVDLEYDAKQRPGVIAGLAEHRAVDQFIRLSSGMVIFSGGLVLIAVFSLPLALLRLTPSLRFFGMELVDRNGIPAARLKTFERWACVWLSPLILTTPLVWIAVKRNLLGPLHLMILWIGAPILIFIIGFICAIATPARGPQDRAVGTWLVPR